MEIKDQIFFVCALAFILLASQLGCGQVAEPLPGALSGLVTLEGESAFSGVTIAIVGTSLTGTTTVDGTFAIINVPAGSYTVNATKSGFETCTLEAVSVEAGKTTAGVNYYLIPTAPPPAPF